MSLKSKGFKVAIFALVWALSILLTVIVTMNIVDILSSPSSKYNVIKTVGKENYSKLVKIKRDGVTKYTYYFTDGSSQTDTLTDDGLSTYIDVTSEPNS